MKLTTIELDDDTYLEIRGDNWSLVGLNNLEAPVGLSSLARDRLLAALLMEPTS